MSLTNALGHFRSISVGDDRKDSALYVAVFHVLSGADSRQPARRTGHRTNQPGSELSIAVSSLRSSAASFPRFQGFCFTEEHQMG